MEQGSKSRGGRPRRFDREAALDIAMRLFWRRGYDGVSVSDITDALGIAPPSLYAAFGNKGDLYREALCRYEGLPFTVDLGGFDEEERLGEAVRRMLASSVRAVTRDDGERGCMISSGMLACHADHADLRDEVKRRRDAFRRLIASKLARWMGEADAASFARYLAALTQGISVQALDGATAGELNAIVTQAVAAAEVRGDRTATTAFPSPGSA